MSKPVFKVVGTKGRVTIPKEMRESSGIASGDVVTIIQGRGSIVVKKAFVLEDDKLSLSAKEALCAGGAAGAAAGSAGGVAGAGGEAAAGGC